jgi:type I restriction enzyme, S subunit
MSFPRYPSYKASGVEWLGAVPEHWATTSLGRVTLDKCDGPFGSGLKSEHYVDAGVRVIRLQNIRRDGFDGTDEAFINETYFREELGGHDVRHGDVLIAGLGDDRNTVGRACVAPPGIEPAMVKADCFRFRLDMGKALPEFVAVQLTAGSVADAGVLSSGSTRSRIPLSVMASRRLVLPPFAEQSHIATFLDRETAKIDELVEEQRRLMELLKEKRQAVISHAVTQGLNSGAPMKPSGIEWLGDVPAHWEVVGLTKYLASVVDYRGRTPTKVDDGVFLLTARNIRDGRLDYAASEEFIAASEYEDVMRRGKPEYGDVLLTTEAPLGQVANVDRTDVALAQRVIKLRGQLGILNNYFLKYWMMGSFCQADMEQLATGSTALGIKGGKVVQLRLCLPPYDEQSSIAAYLDRELVKLDTLTAEAQRAIDLLQERRTALISAAVTGQIDVRPIAGKQPA